MLFEDGGGNDTLSKVIGWAMLNSTGFYNDSDTDEEPLECVRYDKEQWALINGVTFWVDGVVTCVIASVGFFANVISALILGK